MRAGATNTKNKSIVKVTIEGDSNIVNDLVKHIRSYISKPINSWNAKFVEFKELDKVIPVEKHQVTTDNVDKRKWNPNVELYL